MSVNPVHAFMKTSELYLRFTELKSTSFDINKLEPYVFSKNLVAENTNKLANNKPLI